MNPPSERRATRPSTSVGCVLNFAPLAPTTRLRRSYLDECPRLASENWLKGKPANMTPRDPLHRQVRVGC